MKITDKVYALESTKGNYAYLIKGKEPVLIDTGRPGQGKALLKELESMNIKLNDIKHILLTHHDVDHIGNLNLISETTRATIWASEEDIPYIYGEKNRPGIKRLISILMKVKVPGNINPYPPEQKIGEIEVIPTPGHTPGHVCLLYKDVLFAGDLVKTSKGQVEPMTSVMFGSLVSINWDQSLLEKSIKKIAGYSFKWVCPAHGNPVKVENSTIIKEKRE